MLPKGFKIRFSGTLRAIAFDDRNWKAMQGILPQTRVKIEATMKAYCNMGPQNLPPQRFKFEEHFERGGQKVRVEVFKGTNVRFYGVCASLGGTPVFMVTGNDTAKKSNTADQKILRAAGKRGHDIVHKK